MSTNGNFHLVYRVDIRSLPLRKTTFLASVNLDIRGFSFSFLYVLHEKRTGGGLSSEADMSPQDLVLQRGRWIDERER